jgi:hypothetical protein
VVLWATKAVKFGYRWYLGDGKELNYGRAPPRPASSLDTETLFVPGEFGTKSQA